MRKPLTRVTRLLINSARKRHEDLQERRSWEMWISLYPDMIVPPPGAKKPRLTFKPFSQFYQAAARRPAPESKKSKEEILKDVEEICAVARSAKE